MVCVGDERNGMLDMFEVGDGSVARVEGVEFGDGGINDDREREGVVAGVGADGTVCLYTS